VKIPKILIIVTSLVLSLSFITSASAQDRLLAIELAADSILTSAEVSSKNNDFTQDAYEFTMQTLQELLLTSQGVTPEELKIVAKVAEKVDALLYMSYANYLNFSNQYDWWKNLNFGATSSKWFLKGIYNAAFENYNQPLLEAYESYVNDINTIAYPNQYAEDGHAYTILDKKMSNKKLTPEEQIIWDSNPINTYLLRVIRNMNEPVLEVFSETNKGLFKNNIFLSEEYSQYEGRILSAIMNMLATSASGFDSDNYPWSNMFAESGMILTTVGDMLQYFIEHGYTYETAPVMTLSCLNALDGHDSDEVFIGANGNTIPFCEAQKRVWYYFLIHGPLKGVPYEYISAVLDAMDTNNETAGFSSFFGDISNNPFYVDDDIEVPFSDEVEKYELTVGDFIESHIYFWSHVEDSTRFLRRIRIDSKQLKLIPRGNPQTELDKLKALNLTDWVYDFFPDLTQDMWRKMGEETVRRIAITLCYRGDAEETRRHNVVLDAYKKATGKVIDISSYCK